VLEVLVGLLMLVGLVGTVVPLLPGLLLVWAAGLLWVLADGGGLARWTVLGVLTVLLVVGTVAKYALPGRRAQAEGAPATTLMLGVTGMVVGFFIIPVVGLVVGGVLGVYVAERGRLGNHASAWASTRRVLVAAGIGAIVEIGAGLVMIAVWLVGVLVT
jgi:uncharacterized protein YqgC (DUF456 family)